MLYRGQHNHRFYRMLTEAWQHQQAYREQAILNEAYYDGEQYTAQEKAILAERSQQPCVWNICRPAIDSLHALYVDRKTDIQAVGREIEDDELAGVCTHLLKQGFDENTFAHTESQWFRSAAKAGVGWMAVSAGERRIPSNGETEIEIDLTMVHWNEMFWDPYFRKLNGADMRYVIRQIWMDVDQACSLWPDKAEDLKGWLSSFDMEDVEKIEKYAQSSGTNTRESLMYDYDNRSNRIAINECWYFDKDRKLRQCIFADCVFLVGGEQDEDNTDPHGLNIIPYVPVFAERDRRGLPQGILSYIRELQDSLNKLYSKYQWNMSTRQLIYEDGAIDDIDEVRTQIAKPDGIIRIEQGGMSRIQIPNNIAESTQLVAMMNNIIQMAQRVTGLNDALQGLGGTNARSAQQEAGRQLQGAQMQTAMIENMFAAKQRLAWIYLMMMGKYYDKARVVRIVGSNGNAEYFKINEPYLGADGREHILKMKDAMRFDVVIKLVPAFTTVRQNTLSTFAELAKAGAIPPQIVSKLAIELVDLPDKQRLLKETEQAFQQQAQIASQQAAMGA